MWTKDRLIKGVMIVGGGFLLMGVFFLMGGWRKKPKQSSAVQAQIENSVLTAEENLAEFGEHAADSTLKTPVKKKVYYFHLNSDVLNNQAKFELQKIANYCKKNPELMIRLDGHADVQGPSAFNEQLSERRADSVKYYLEQQSIDPHQIEVYAHSNRELMDLDDTEVAHAKNRRVELSYH